MEMSQHYPLSSLDDFHPTLAFDDNGSLGFQMTYAYDDTYTWHLKNSFTSIGKTSVPSEYLQNIIFEAPTASPLSGKVTSKGLVNWNPNATIMANNGVVVANQVVDMSTQIDSVTLTDGTVVADWTLAPVNTAFATASGKTFTPLKASNKTNIKIMNGTAQIGTFSVRVLSEGLYEMAQYLSDNPLHKQYQASLIRESDSALIATGLHQDNYFSLEDKLKGTKKGVLLYGNDKVPIGFKKEADKIVADAYGAYPLDHYLPGQSFPLDDPYSYLTDSLNPAFPSEAKVIIKSSLNQFFPLFSSYLLGDTFKELTESASEPGFIGASFDKTNKEFTFELYQHAEGTSDYTKAGYQIKVAIPSQGDEEVENFLVNGTAPDFIKVPTSLVSAYSVLSETKNYTLESSSYWTKKGSEEKMESGDELKGVENKAHLYQTTCRSYIDGNDYYGEDLAHYCYKGAVIRNDKLYLINGIPDYVKGVTTWMKTDVTSCTVASSSETKDILDLWQNTNVMTYLTSAEVVKENLDKLNLHTLNVDEIL
jgi:hypothetical protein